MNHKRSLISIVLGTLILAGIAFLFIITGFDAPIGGERDENGCLGPAGYSWNPGVDACVREFELNADTRRAARIAVEAVGPSYALTVVRVDAAECVGCFMVTLERGEERTQETVRISDWQIPASYPIQLFYYDPNKDADETGNVLCSRAGLVPVEREIESSRPIEDTLRLLLEGNITSEERERGVTTEFPLPGVELRSTALDENGVLTLEFADPQFKTSGGACRAGILWLQIEATAKQFPEVREVRFSPEEFFQP